MWKSIFLIFLIVLIGCDNDMTVKIITENILDTGDFSSATEQDGAYVDQPWADAGNSGYFKPVTSGTPADFSYDGVATTNGDAAKTTVIDAELDIYGDDYFIGATIAISDFCQGTSLYTEQDTAARITLTDANTVTITNLDLDEDAWLVKDFTAAHFSGDFEFHTDVNCTGAAGGNANFIGVWALTNATDTLTDIDTASGDYLAVVWAVAAGSHYLKLRECNDGVLTTDTSVALSTSTDYYLKIVRNEAVGTFGTLYCYIYSSADHSSASLVDTLTVTLTEKQDFQYLMWVVGDKDGSGGFDWDGTISNLQIVKATETKTITDFTRSTGTLTHGAFSYRVNIGTQFVLTVDAETRDYRVELVSSGDAGTATFKWSHDGGTTYFGRNSPSTATYIGDVTVSTDVDGTTGSVPHRGVLLQGQNNTQLMIFKKDSDSKYYTAYSTDNGITYGNEISFDTSTTEPTNILCAKMLSSGRIFAFDVGSYGYYSDDNCATWNRYEIVGSRYITDFVELSNGLIFAVSYSASVRVQGQTSSDGCFSWSDQVEILAGMPTEPTWPSCVQANNGNVVVSYATDVDSANDSEIACKISSDNGATFGTEIDIMDFAGNDFRYSRLVKDINGDIYCIFDETAAGLIAFKRSTTSGSTWGAKTTLYSDGGANTVCGPYPALIDGHLLICSFLKQLAEPTELHTVRRGYWNAYNGTNGCPCALNGIEQMLICDAGIAWNGGAGITGDSWSFDTGYDYAMSNIISHSPSRSWRSVQDNIACNIVLDLGTNERFLATGVGFFGCNVRTLSFQMNATDAWTSPSVNEAISFDLTTAGVVDSASGNAIQDAALLASYKDHFFSSKGKAERYYMRMTSGTDSGLTWEIKDNIGGYFILNTTASTNIAQNDTFAIYQSFIADTFTGGVYRFMRIAISAQQTSDDYYKIGVFLPGYAIAMNDEWGVEFSKPHVYNIDFERTESGGMYPVVGYGRKRMFELTWPYNQTSGDQITAIADHLEGKSLVLIPNHSTLTDCYLVKMVSNLDRKHFMKNTHWNTSLTFEEVI